MGHEGKHFWGERGKKDVEIWRERERERERERGRVDGICRDKLRLGLWGYDGIES